MDTKVPSGKYVLAVSGGVDSMALLHMLAPQQNLSGADGNRIAEHQVFGAGLSNLTGVELVIAHFNHGVREDSAEDEKLVAAAAKEYGLPFEAGHGRLGAGASEETARKARYEFLESVRAKHGAGALITAHHQDDLIETAMINLLRGTGRRGLAAISSNKKVLRPLLNYPKKDILNYAKQNNLKWREDSTNDNQDYLRNYIRRNLIPKMSKSQRQKLLDHLEQISTKNIKIESELTKLSPKIQDLQVINRSRFSSLPSDLGNELLVHWLRQEGLLDFDKRTINRLNVALRTAKPGSVHPVKKGLSIKIGPKKAQFNHPPLR